MPSRCGIVPMHVAETVKSDSFGVLGFPGHTPLTVCLRVLIFLAG